MTGSAGLKGPWVIKGLLLRDPTCKGILGLVNTKKVFSFKKCAIFFLIKMSWPNWAIWTNSFLREMPEILIVGDMRQPTPLYI